MSDFFDDYSKTLESPADHHFVITPSDTADLAIIPRALRVGGAGTLSLRDKAGQDITYTVFDGEVVVFRAVRVLATGTTAGNIVGWY